MGVERSILRIKLKMIRSLHIFLIASAFLATALAAMPPAPEYKHVPAESSDPPPPPRAHRPRPMKKRYSRAAPAYKPAPEPPSKQWSIPRDHLINYPANYNPFGKRSASFYDIQADQPKKVKLPPVYQPATYKEEELPPQ